ncbi:MAG TPA: SDR family NAD(P)-dependent oxidoreductase [Vicinamibacteria bacterium]|jgi:3-oxoacyl-[acyl-carrier protein] reductase
MLTLAGRTALVTGASRGIGRHTAILMTRLGARVALGYGRDEAAAREALAATGGDGVVLGADLAKEGEAEKLVARADEALSGLDVLVANHGIWKRAPIESMTAAQWDEMLVTNLSSVRALCSEAARRMLKRGRGSIVLVASTAGQRGEPFHSHYAASKGAILALTRSLASELGPRGVRVNCVSPGWVDTGMSHGVLEGDEADTILRAIPLGRPGTPDEIAGPIAFLASDLSSYLHGQILSVNGGAVMTG